MKKTLTYILSLLALVVAVGACANGKEKPKPAPTPEKSVLTLSANEWKEVTSFGDEMTLKVTAGGEWSVSGAPDWVEVTPSSGQGNSDVTIKVAENGTSSNRSAELLFTPKGGDAVKFSITQLNLENDNVPLWLSEEELTAINSAGEERTITIKSSTRWTASTKDDWLKFEPATGITITEVKIIAEANESKEGRTGVVTFKAGEQVKELKVIQNNKDVTNLALDKTEFDVSHEATTVTVNATGSEKWTTKVSESWVTVDPAEGISGEVKISIEQNTTPYDRSAKVTFDAKLGGVLEVIINQESRPVTKVSADKDKLDVDMKGGTFTVNVTGSEEWKASTSGTWLTVSPTSGKDATVTITVGENLYKADRVGTVTFDAGPGGVATVDVIQKGNPNATTFLKKMLMEEATGENCPYCPAGAKVIKSLKDKYGDNFIVMAYHGDGSFCPRNSPLYSAVAGKRINYLKFPGFPTAIFNRSSKAMGRGEWNGHVGPRMNDQTTVGITIDKPKLSDNKLEVEASIIGINTVWSDYTNIRIQMDVVEDNIIHKQANGGDNYNHLHVYRGRLNGESDTLGDVVSQDKEKYTGSIELKSTWKTHDLEVIVFVYGTKGGKEEVIQVESRRL